MKTRVYIVVTTFLILFSSCSKDDDKLQIASIEINFVYVDGTPISTGTCINPSSKYAISVQVISEGNGQMNPTQIEYTLNGVKHSTTFNSPGTKILPVVLINGPNIAQLSDNGATKSINYVTQGEFKLVR